MFLKGNFMVLRSFCLIIVYSLNNIRELIFKKSILVMFYNLYFGRSQ